MHADNDLSPGERSILEAAAEAFARAGFDSVSIADIAVQAGVSKANIFHHFKSKEALYLAVMREACKGHAEFTEALLARADVASVEKLRQLIRYDFEDLFENEQRSHLVVREILNTGCRTGRTMIQPVFLRNFNAVVGLLRQGQERGEFRRDLDPSVVAWMIGGTVMIFFQNRESLGHFPGMDGRIDPAGYAEKVYRIVLGGLCAEPAAGAATRVRRASNPVKTRKRVPQ
ncbi:MAG: hypothetical protein NVS9B10_30750 [Nevskia sp.]